MSPSVLGRILDENRDAIVARFVAEGRRNALAPDGLSRSALIDHIPAFLDEVVAELSREEGVRFSQDAYDESPTARAHGTQRWTLGYDLEGLVREYGILRHAILAAVSEAGASISLGEFDVLSKCLNVGIAEAATAYIRFRDEQLKAEHAAVEFLAEAGQVLSSSLDYRSTLARLTALIVPQLADWCAVRLDDDTDATMTIAHVDPAKVELVRELYRGSSEKLAGSLNWQKVLRTGEPELAQEANAVGDDEVLLRRRALASSWLIVPLRIQEKVFGTVTLAFGDSSRAFSPADLPLASELARRASVAVDNARLYRLSQLERSRAEAATRAKDEFVAVVSHELRTPLNAILGWTRLLLRGTLPAGQERQALGVIERNAHAQAQLVDDLLDVSRVMSGKIRINPAQVDLCDIVRLAVEGVRPAADAKRVRLEVDLEHCDVVFRGDGDRIQQVAWILLSNAIKYTAKDLGLVRVRLRRVESVFELTVEDNGIGIEADFLPHVFETFRQSETGTSRGHGGLGVGLSIAKHLVERHGGVIEAQSDGKHKGVRMVVRLPISPLVSGTMGIRSVAATTTASGREAPSPRAEGIWALVVDDDLDARELLTFVLESSGMHVQAAQSGTEGMAALHARRFDIVISDIGMADGDGYELIRAIRTGPHGWRNVPAIALTAYSSHDDRARALTEGFNRHMVKPTEPEKLVSAVLELVS